MIRELLIQDNKNRIVDLLNKHQMSKTNMNDMPIDDISLGYYENDEYLGGIIAKQTGNRLHISLLAVNEKNRGMTIGSKLIREIEVKAREKNCYYLTVNTQDFQGLKFYQKSGFQIFGQLTDCPFEGTTKYFLQKNLRGCDKSF